jgi:hypothetical protein
VALDGVRREAREGSEMEHAVSVVESIPWFAWIAIIAIISGATTKMLAMSHHHRERMEMIRMGMNPDSPTTPASYGKPPAHEEL